LRIESLLLKEEFNYQLAYFNKTFDNIFKASELILNSCSLANMMIHICKTGNFINDVIFLLFFLNLISFVTIYSLKGEYSGNAIGFKLSSLNKLADLKSNKCNITLLHVIIQVIFLNIIFMKNELISLRDVFNNLSN
jgi:hypothetical protein